MWAQQEHKGFTIVELLIVIVMIAILATITIVAFNGVQQQATNNKTIAAANTWVKALKLYKTDNGRWPSGWVCLGQNYLYGVSGTDTSGTAQCRQTNATGYLVNTSFNNSLRQYMSNDTPDPAFVTAVNADGSQWRRGIHYAYGGGDGTQVYIDIAYAGNLSSCPVIQGFTGSRSLWGTETYCNYMIGRTSDS